MAQAKPTAKLTYADYCNTPDDERWELLYGELTMAPSPTTAHQTVLFNLARVLADFAELASLGQVFVAPFDVVLSDTNVVQPDIVFISRDRIQMLTEANIRGAPDLVVEVLSPATASRDWRVKLDLYAEHGVQEYWVVDPDGQRVWLMSRVDNKLTEVANYGPSDAMTSPTLTGFAPDLSQVFRRPGISASN